MYKFQFKIMRVNDKGESEEVFYDDVVEFEGEKAETQNDTDKIFEIGRKVIPNYDEVIKNDLSYRIYRKRIS